MTPTNVLADTVRDELKIVAADLVTAFKGMSTDLKDRGAKLAKVAVDLGDAVLAKQITADDARKSLRTLGLAIVSEVDVAGYRSQSLIVDGLTKVATAVLRVAGAALV